MHPNTHAYRLLIFKERLADVLSAQKRDYNSFLLVLSSTRAIILLLLADHFRSDSKFWCLTGQASRQPKLATCHTLEKQKPLHLQGLLVL